MKYTHDLAVAYRIYPSVSKPAMGLPFSDDKYQLSEVCLRSFKESLGPVRAKVWAILDGCPGDYARLFQKYFDDHDLTLVPCNSIGNHATFSKQIDILLQQDSAPVVQFAEDDYFYLPNQFSAMLSFLTQHPDDFISPYDHLDCYTLPIHEGPKFVQVCDSHHWRTAYSTCLTFLCRQETLARYEKVFRSYSRGNFDCSLWLSITKQRVRNPFAFAEFALRHQFFSRVLIKSWVYGWQQILLGRKARLWTPVPAIATHLNKQALSPTIDWARLMIESCQSHSTVAS